MGEKSKRKKVSTKNLIGGKTVQETEKTAMVCGIEGRGGVREYRRVRLI